VTSSDSWLGAGNTLGDYGLVLLFYAALVVLMRYAHPRIEPGFLKTYAVLAIGWAVGTFVGNYLLWRAGFMSFLPWLNNVMHTVVWIGLCLGFLYAGARSRPWLEQFLLFAIFSFIVKQAEHRLLGTWELDHFFFIPGNAAYILGWSALDGLYPTISVVALRLLSRRIPGLAVAPIPAGYRW
jgi:hypothetical protein